MRGEDLDKASAQAVRRANEEAFRKAVLRQWKAGLSDDRIAKVLEVRRERVKAVREQLGLERNPGGAS